LILPYKNGYLSTVCCDIAKYNSIFLKGKEQGLSQGLSQGKEEEKEKWRIKIISYGLKQNQALEDIASLAEISVDEVKQYIKDNHLDNN
ncbi:hypothetical protein KTQ89_08225, partial [Holdemanella porci]|uniref:hypothetical protein n=1 Tax=Holdemanella porci TaxID=2652276 RepID=UPI001C2B950E